MSAPRDLAQPPWPGLAGGAGKKSNESVPPAGQPEAGTSEANVGANGEPSAQPQSATPAAGAPAATEFRQLFEEHAPRVYRLLLRMGVASRDAEDLCQEVFVTAHRNWQGFRGDAKRSTWLCGIAVRLAANHRRLARVRRERLLDNNRETSTGTSPPQAEQRLHASERATTLHRVLATLSEQHREVLVLYELEELGMAEVAECLGLPLQTGYSRLYAARKALSQALKRAAAQGEL